MTVMRPRNDAVWQQAHRQLGFHRRQLGTPSAEATQTVVTKSEGVSILAVHLIHTLCQTVEGGTTLATTCPGLPHCTEANLLRIDTGPDSSDRVSSRMLTGHGRHEVPPILPRADIMPSVPHPLYSIVPRHYVSTLVS